VCHQNNRREQHLEEKNFRSNEKLRVKKKSIGMVMTAIMRFQKLE
jgi:hypothetical protein